MQRPCRAAAGSVRNDKSLAAEIVAQHPGKPNVVLDEEDLLHHDLELSRPRAQKPHTYGQNASEVGGPENEIGLRVDIRAFRRARVCKVL